MYKKCLWIVAAAGWCATPALADFMEDWDHPYKWDQMQPDFEYASASFYDDLPDVYQTTTADDWRCMEPSWLTDVHFVGWVPFGNFWIDHFRVTVWSDVPATPDDESHPGDILWTYEAYDWVADEDTYLNYGLTIYDINIPGDPDDPYGPDTQWFWQEGTPDQPIIYWLSVEGIMTTDDGFTDIFYWSFKDRYLPTNLDDAAYYSDTEGIAPWSNWGWPVLNGPPELYEGPFPDGWEASADMAFGLTFYIPQPTSIALLGLGGLIANRRR